VMVTSSAGARLRTVRGSSLAELMDQMRTWQLRSASTRICGSPNTANSTVGVVMVERCSGVAGRSAIHSSRPTLEPMVKRQTGPRR